MYRMDDDADSLSDHDDYRDLRDEDREEEDVEDEDPFGGVDAHENFVGEVGVFDGFVRLPGEPDSNLTKRLAAMRRLQADMERPISEWIYSTNQPIFNEIADFVALKREAPDSFSKLPCGVVHAGPTLGDHPALFQLLAQHIRATKQVTVALLRASCCNTAEACMKSLMFAIRPELSNVKRSLKTPAREIRNWYMNLDARKRVCVRPSEVRRGFRPGLRSSSPHSIPLSSRVTRSSSSACSSASSLPPASCPSPLSSSICSHSISSSSTCSPSSSSSLPLSTSSSSSLLSSSISSTSPPSISSLLLSTSSSSPPLLSTSSTSSPLSVSPSPSIDSPSSTTSSSSLSISSSPSSRSKYVPSPSLPIPLFSRKNLSRPSSNSFTPSRSKLSALKKRSLNHALPSVKREDPIVIILEDFKAFDVSILDFLIHALRTHPSLASIPFVLVFGLVDEDREVDEENDDVVDEIDRRQEVYDTFDEEVVQRLFIQSFTLPMSRDFLLKPYPELLMPKSSSLPLSFSRRTLHYFLQHFVASCCSVQMFLKALRYAIARHVGKFALGYLADSEAFSNWLKGDTWNDAAIRQLPSVRKALDIRPAPSPKELRDRALEWMQALNSHRKLLSAHFSVLYATARRFLPDGLDAVKLRLLVLGYPIENLVDLEGMFRGLRTLDYISLAELVQTWKTNLQLPDDLKKADEFLLALQNPMPVVLSAIRKSERMRSGVKRREALLETAHAHQSASDPLRNELSQWFLEFCRDRLSVRSLPLHELVLCDQRLDDFGTLAGAALPNSLKGPLVSDGVSKPDDLGTLFRVYEESARVINLSDWFRAFRLLITPKDYDDLDERAESQFQDRFVFGVFTLKFLGLLRDSTLGPEHAVKLSAAHITYFADDLTKRTPSWIEN